MIARRDNYAIQAEDARVRFLHYDQEAMAVRNDGDFLYLSFCGCPHRVRRADGRIFRQAGAGWVAADSHGEVLTVFDFLCDAKPHRVAAGEFVSMASLGGHVHQGLSLHSGALEEAIDREPERFRSACLALGGVPGEGGDLCYDLELLPGLPVRLRFWYSDEEFPPVLDLLWDRNTLDFLRYETTWYAAGVLRRHVREAMNL